MEETKGIYKVCSKCHRILHITEFYKFKMGKYGTLAECKECMKKYNKETYRKKTFKEYEYTEEELSKILRKCVTCGKILPLTNFSKNKNCKLGFKHKCKKCCSEYYKNRRNKTKKKINKLNKFKEQLELIPQAEQLKREYKELEELINLNDTEQEELIEFKLEQLELKIELINNNRQG